MRPFFMSIVSDSNHWMFISSNGGVSAGRKNAEFSLFPYYTDDKITESADITGSKTIIQVLNDEEISIWEPFSERFTGKYNIERNLYKNRWGNKVMFEETNHDFGLTFRYEWNSSNAYGFVKHSCLLNYSENAHSVRVLDGIQNILPYGVMSEQQTRVSNLVDAYKRSELVKETGLGIFALSAIIVDKAEPSEALKTNVAWSYGCENPSYFVSSLQVNRFRNGEPVTGETDVKGEKGAYFVHSEMNLEAGSEKTWSIVANVNQDHAQVIELNERLKSKADLARQIEEDVEAGTRNLLKLIANADGLQGTSDSLKDARHYSNVLYNIMRGGIFDNHYSIEKEDFSRYLKNANQEVYSGIFSLLESLPDVFGREELIEKAKQTEDADFIRLSKEYLPLKFSRRHGDPSRPWNRFSINTRNEADGSKILDYEGNWRDIFQNWEALAHSYPEFMEGMIFKFLNASTFDGYNPYRVTKGGFDWETIEPDDPWSYIGYWGDHQIIYLLKFLEFYRDQKPDEFEHLFEEDVFVYANVPYQIRSYEEIVENPKDTIDFDHESDLKIRERVQKSGADGALLGSRDLNIHHVNFIEKILATVLAKVSNFIPEGGIWMNTQRPEWNDANNALVGNGVSMVTLYYLRRFLTFFEPILANSKVLNISVSIELAIFFNSILEVLKNNAALLEGDFSDETRKKVTDGLGQAGSNYRNSVYSLGFSGEKTSISVSSIHEFFRVANTFLEHSIAANKRGDNLYHAYNLMSVEEDGISISYLDEMLEGQVAVLSSGYLNAEESLEVLDALRASSLYREDQASYILYPNKSLPGFLQKNEISKELVQQSKLLEKLVAEQHRQIIVKDIHGGFHFNGDFKNANDLSLAIDNLESPEFSSLVKQEKALVLDIFEKVFNHKAFTGRSGTFYGYEGLGSIYWHMVSKLYLAAFEVCDRVKSEQVTQDTFTRLTAHFYEIGEGIGIHKSPEVYGAFPTDPYSHTPYHRGAQQPGMTGQVKEDILARFGELGVRIENNRLSFDPIVLSSAEFTSQEQKMECISLEGESYELIIPGQGLGFTICQVPVVYVITGSTGIEVYFKDGSSKLFSESSLDVETSRQVFSRSGSIHQVIVSLTHSQLIQTEHHAS
ncbi:MAG: hypothetical protein MI700_14310 [Balneolales bacterium]|nr:hypothetical protein [Balneolales bacterium]